MEIIKRYSSYIPLAGIVTILVILFCTVYAVAQNTMQAGANWPQVQIAEDGANKLNNNMTPQSLISGPVNISKSLATYTNVYDLTGRVVTGAGYLDGQVAVPPRAVLTAANDTTYHTVTWQPKDGVRIAAVVVKAKNYYVLSGRSLTEVDKSIGHVRFASFIGLLLSLTVLTGVIWSKHYFKSPKYATREHSAE